MFYDELKELAKQPQVFAPLAGLLNPATIIPITVIGISSITAIAVVKKLKGNNKKLSAENAQLLVRKENVEGAFKEYVEQMEYDDYSDFEPHDQLLSEPLPTVESNSSSTIEYMDDAALKKEMMRQTMSELGKRSAEARRKKKLENHELTTICE